MIGFAVFLAHPVFANVVINEIAWMGTSNSANDEWIELYNSGTNAVDVTGWKLTNADNSIQINLTGTLGAGGYGLLERTDDTTVPNVTALTVYVGALGNNGEFLTLRDAVGSVIDSIDNRSSDPNKTGWVKGDNTTKQTMQKSGSGWITADATPGAINKGVDSTPPDTDGENNDPTDVLLKTTTNKEDQENLDIMKNPVYTIQMTMPEIITGGTPVTISSVIKINNKYETMVGKFEYSTGDGQFFTWTQNKPLEYTYHHAGNYVFRMNYYDSIFTVKPSAVFQKTITVIADSISINSLNAGILEIKNNSTDTIDLAGFTIQMINHPDQKFVFPETFILQGSSIFMRPEQLGFYINKKSDSILRNASGDIVNANSHLSTTGSNYSVQNTPTIVNPYDTIPAYAEPNYLGENLVSHNEVKSTGPAYETISQQIKNLSKQIGMMLISGTSKTVLIIIVLLIVIGLFGYGEWYIYKMEQKNKKDDEIDIIDYPDSENSNIVL